MKRISIFIPSVLIVLTAFLYGTYSYEYEQNRDFIEQDNCASDMPLRVPKDYINPMAEKKSYREGIFYKESNYFSLKDKSLIGLPDDLFKNKDCIKQLDLSNNLLEELPETVNDLIDLRALFLSNNYLDYFSANGFEILNKLYIKDNQLKSIDINGFYDLDILDVSSNLLKTIEPISKATVIEEIDLTKCKFTVFPSDLLNVSGLKTLRLKDNAITELSLPEGFGFFDKIIQKLDVSNNQITKFPTEFGQFLNLKKLNLQGNKLEGAVEIIGFPKLIKIEITDQNITSFLMEERSGLAMQSIDLMNNQLTSFEIKGWHASLSVLSLANNKLTEFPKGIDRLNLIKVDVSNNQINIVPDLSSTHRLRELLLSNNQIRTLPDLSRLINLKVIQLSNNKFEKIPEKSNLPNNNYLTINLSNNEIISVKTDDLSENIIYLDLSNNNLTDFTGDTELLYLEHLDLSNNPYLLYLSPDLLEKMKGLKYLDIEGTSIINDRALVDYCKRKNIKLITGNFSEMRDDIDEKLLKDIKNEIEKMSKKDK